MEPDQKPLFGLNIDDPTKIFLYESARWGKFLAIVGLVSCSLLLIVGLFLAISQPDIDSQVRTQDEKVAYGIGMGIGCVILASVYFFPCMYLLRFSNHMKAALVAEDQQRLATSFQNLKSMFKFVGILTIILIVIYGLAFLTQLASRG